jgi:hypothetical protein
MDSDLTVMRLQEKGGPIDNDNTYNIDGSEKDTLTVKTQFIDKVTWENDKLLVKKLKLPEKAYELHVYRWLEKGGKVLKMVRFVLIYFSCLYLTFSFEIFYRRQSIKT